ncbi:MAG: serine/threonine protein kinase [Myxococcales bacterium]|nr:MAG: serine/threonine protein kinase [Myxococcales bacterium]
MDTTPPPEPSATREAEPPRGAAVLPRAAAASPRATPGKGAFARKIASVPPAAGPPERYEAMKTIGTGVFGTVDLVRDNDIARVVARKRLKPEWRQGETLLRFVDEIKVIGQLEHPGIVPIHDVGIDDQGYFFVMKYVEGDTLAQLISRLKAGDPEVVARHSHEARTAIFLQVLDAIGFAHEKGIVHRDLKPENIIVGRHGEVMIMDWGLARRLDPGRPPPRPAAEDPAPASTLGLPATERSPLVRDSVLPAPVVLVDAHGDPRLTATRDGEVIGTPAYMSPEQARGRHDQIDARSDLYSLAAVFYELLALDHYLTPKATSQHMLVGVISEEPLAATAIHHRHGVPPEYTFFLRRGLSKDPAGRFQSAAEMARALREIRDGHIAVQCPCTGLKAAGNRWFDFIDAHPVGALTTAVLTGGCTLYGAYALAQRLLALLAG